MRDELLIEHRLNNFRATAPDKRGKFLFEISPNEYSCISISKEEAQALINFLQKHIETQ